VSPPLRALGLALACAHLVAASAPCGVGRILGPGRPEAGAHRHGDEAHAAGSRATRAHADHDAHAAHDGSTHAGHDAHASHDGSGHAAHGAAPVAHPHDPGAEAAAVASMRAPCPCGCDRAPGRDVPGHRLDPALLRADASIESALARFAPVGPAPAPPAVDPDAPEPVPILA